MRCYPFEMIKLPFDYEDLEPVIDSETVYLHYNMHYGNYVKTLNELIYKHRCLQKMDLYYMVNNPNVIPKCDREKIMRNIGGVINHEIYFNSLTGEKTSLNNELMNKIITTFGSYDTFKSRVIDVSMSVFGSGYGAVGVDKGKLCIYKLKNQQISPIKPILLIDVWEHSYYLKYKNQRKEYIENIFSILNFDVLNYRYKKRTVM